jgi:hypothetical protein
VAVEEGWQRRYPPRKLNLDAIQDLLGTAAMEAELLGGGLRNPNYRLHLAGDPRPVVLRLYTADTAACAREVSLMGLVGERAPVPRALSADPTTDPPWALFEWMDGVRFDRMLVHASTQEVQHACRSPGRSPRRHSQFCPTSSSSGTWYARASGNSNSNVGRRWPDSNRDSVLSEIPVDDDGSARAPRPAINWRSRQRH